jgi:hypothetical protein
LDPQDFKFIRRGKTIKMRFGVLIAAIIISVCNVGCIAAIAPNAMSVAASGAPVASNHLGGGKAESFWIARYGDVIEAALQAGEALSLEVKEKKIGKDQTFFRFSSNKESVDLLIESRSDTVTYIKFDVGWFGSVAFGRLVGRQIIDELSESGAFLENWRDIKKGAEEPGL